MRKLILVAVPLVAVVLLAWFVIASRHDPPEDESSSGTPTSRQQNSVLGPEQRPPLGHRSHQVRSNRREDSRASEIAANRGQEQKSLFSHDEALRLLEEGRAFSQAMLTPNVEAHADARRQLNDTISTLNHRIKIAHEEKIPVEHLETAREDLVLYMASIVDDPQMQEAFPAAVLDLLKLMGISRDPAAIPILIGHISFRDPNPARGGWANRHPVYEALAYMGEPAIAQILEHAGTEEDLDRVRGMALALRTIAYELGGDADSYIEDRIRREGNPDVVGRLERFSQHVRNPPAYPPKAPRD